MGLYGSRSRLVLRPETTLEVSRVLQVCSQEGIPIVPQGGNTGLVGGSVPVYDEIVLSLSLMDKIHAFDSVSGILECQAGCVLESLDNYLAERGHMMPLDLGAKGTCQIGGNVATNAGGLRYLRYGSLHANILGLEVVRADGTIMHLGKPLRKDNTGYHLKNLMIGSEGTLGVITGVTISTPPRPKSVQLCLLGLRSYDHVQRVFQTTRQHLGEILSAFEFFDRSSLDLVIGKMDKRDPLPEQCPFYILFETHGSNTEHDASKVDGLLQHLMEQDMITDGTLAQDEKQKADFWALREGIPEACAKQGGMFKYDLSVPLPKLYELVETVKTHLAAHGLYNGDQPVTAQKSQTSQKSPESTDAKPKVTHVVGYGHIGDGNLHLNILSRGPKQEIARALDPFIYELTQKYRGSISAEHGLGVMKAPYLKYSQSKETIAMMRDIKQLWDPKGILNPHKLFPKN